MTSPSEWMQQAIDLAVDNVRRGRGGPFGALVVLNGELIGTGANAVTTLNDPTAHAEVMAIRAACTGLGSFQLPGCEIYTSCEPCPMCLGAIYWARPAQFYYACSRADAAAAGFDDDHIYNQLSISPETRTIRGSHLTLHTAGDPFRAWHEAAGRLLY